MEAKADKRAAAGLEAGRTSIKRLWSMPTDFRFFSGRKHCSDAAVS